MFIPLIKYQKGTAACWVFLALTTTHNHLFWGHPEVNNSTKDPSLCEGEAPIVAPFSTTLTSLWSGVHLDLEL